MKDEVLVCNQVLNAGKNKIKSMNEISSLVNLCALILNGELEQHKSTVLSLYPPQATTDDLVSTCCRQ